MNDESSFAEAAASESGGSIVSELWSFLGQNKKWWLAPVVIALLLLGLLMILSSSAAAPFIYTLF